MNIDLFELFTLACGILLATMGGLVVLSDTFLEYMYRSFWKPTGTEKKVFGNLTTGRTFDRYVRGLGSCLAGITMIIWFLRNMFN